jgi:hypothetical protein
MDMGRNSMTLPVPPLVSIQVWCYFLCLCYIVPSATFHWSPSQRQLWQTPNWPWAQPSPRSKFHANGKAVSPNYKYDPTHITLKWKPFQRSLML